MIMPPVYHGSKSLLSKNGAGGLILVTGMFLFFGAMAVLVFSPHRIRENVF